MLYNNETYYTQDGNYNFTGIRPNYNFNHYQIKNMPRHEAMSNNQLDNFASTNSTIDGDSPIAESEVSISPDNTRAPANRRDPIYTAIPGLKWKSKSKKWVVRWDNPVTNRRVYKYFSGQRYGFIGAHKRAAFYLEFLNASVGKGSVSSGENPFFRRNEGPPKGKTNKGLQRKYRQSSHYHKNIGGNKMSDYKYQNPAEHPFNIMSSPGTDVNTGNIDFLSAEHLLSTPIDLHYIYQTGTNTDPTMDKGNYTEYPDMYNSWKHIPTAVNQSDQSIGNIDMMNYPTYIYNPQNFNDQFCQYEADDRYYRPLPYIDQANTPTQYNMQYQNVHSNENQKLEEMNIENQLKHMGNNNNDKDMNFNTPIQSGDYNYDLSLCQTPINHQQHNIYNTYDNIEYFNQNQIDGNRNNDNVTQSVSVNWNRGYDNDNNKRNINDQNTSWKSYKRANLDN